MVVQEDQSLRVSGLSNTHLLVIIFFKLSLDKGSNTSSIFNILCSMGGLHSITRQEGLILQ